LKEEMKAYVVAWVEEIEETFGELKVEVTEFDI